MSFLGQLNEAIKAFRNKNERPTDKQAQKEMGEGYEDIASGFGVNSLGSFNTFYSKYVNKNFDNEVQKIRNYRKIAEFPEISDVIDDAVNESLQEDTEGYIVNYEINDETISKKEQVVKTLNDEFYDLFYNRLKIEENLDHWYESYYTDGRVYLENVIDENNHKRGLLNIKKLPSETMDYYWNSKTGRVDFYIQYLKPNMKKPETREEAEKEKDIIVFEPQQINFIPFKYGRTKNSIIGYLEKCKTAYNILKLLETSLVIYRIVRAPERLVFKIDVGNMPRDKGMKFVEKVKQKMNNKQSFDPNTGTLVNSNEILSILDSYFIPQGDNRGSDISTIGGNSNAFTDLGDIHYFHKKLYRALKYPISRVEKQHGERSDDVLFRGRSLGEISRDEIKWAVFLEKNQKKWCNVLKDIFLIHLEFKGLKKQYGLDRDNIQISFNPPSDYKEQMDQSLLEQRHRNYSELSREEEFSKYFLIKRYLQWDDDMIKENMDGHEKDIKFKLKKEEGERGGW